jgi:hypothetical protein
MVCYSYVPLIVHMEVHGGRWLPLIDERRIKARDIKLWERDEIHAHAHRRNSY